MTTTVKLITLTLMLASFGIGWLCGFHYDGRAKYIANQVRVKYVGVGGEGREYGHSER